MANEHAGEIFRIPEYDKSLKLLHGFIQDVKRTVPPEYWDHFAFGEGTMFCPHCMGGIEIPTANIPLPSSTGMKYTLTGRLLPVTLAEAFEVRPDLN